MGRIVGKGEASEKENVRGGGGRTKFFSKPSEEGTQEKKINSFPEFLSSFFGRLWIRVIEIAKAAVFTAIAFPCASGPLRESFVHARSGCGCRGRRSFPE